MSPRRRYASLPALLPAVLLAAVAAHAGAAAPAPAPLQPPRAKKVAHATQVGGKHLRDDYHWLRDKSNPQVRAYLEAENRYALAALRPTEGLRAALRKEMISHLKETDLTVPYREGAWYYNWRTQAGKQYGTLVRQRRVAGDGASVGDAEVVLDLNALAAGKKFLGLGAWQVSDDGNLLAYALDTTGFRQYTLHTLDLRSGKAGVEAIPRVDSIAWAADNHTLYYVVEDEVAKRPFRLYRHTVGQSGKDVLLYEEKDDRFTLDVDRSRSKAFVFLSASSHTSAEWRFLPADRPDATLGLIAPREPDHQYWVDHGGDRFYIVTDGGGRRTRRLVTAPVADPGPKSWREVLPARPDVTLQGVMVFAHHYVRFERENGLPQIVVVDLASGSERHIDFDEPAYQTSAEHNEEFDTTKLRFDFTSPITPPSIYDYDLATGERTLLKQVEVPGYDRSRYQSERLSATAPDGTAVPITVVYRKGVPRNGKAPLYLEGYGAYGYSYPLAFNAPALSLLDRGVILAAAHVRGGGEMGKPWHDAGRMMNKRNTFTDFIACAEHLVAEGYTSKDRLAIHGTSAGGLLVGAVVNLRPDLFKAVVAEVPFVDVMNTMLDESLPLTVGEFEEWGNPKIPEQFDYMMSYSPYDNLRATAYPALLVMTSWNDSQVMYWEPAKYVARLRALKTDRHPLLLHVNMSGGHGGASGRYDQLDETALKYAFVLTQLGIAR
jgi:oligopeptidase B